MSWKSCFLYQEILIIINLISVLGIKIMVIEFFKQYHNFFIYIYQIELLYFLCIVFKLENYQRKMIPEQQFLGVFENENYTITKSYIETEIQQIFLYHTKFTPKDPKYTLCIVHGFGEHSTRFKLIADFYAKKQFQVLMVDLRGFGYSGGVRGCAQLRQLQNDVISLLKTARTDLPLFLYAHSMGGLTVIKLLLEKPQLNVSGCIITSPLLGLAKNMHFNWVKKQFIYFLGDELSDFIVNSRINPTALTKKTKYLHTIFDDRLMIPFMSVKMAKYVFQGLDYVKENQSNFKYPIIILHGKQDTVTNIQDSREFVFKNPRPFKELCQFPNGYHEMQHDAQKDELLSKTIEFIQKIPDKKNFGFMYTRHISKPQQKKFFIIRFLMFVIGIIKFILNKITFGRLGKKN